MDGTLNARRLVGAHRASSAGGDPAGVVMVPDCCAVWAAVLRGRLASSRSMASQLRYDCRAPTDALRRTSCCEPSAGRMDSATAIASPRAAPQRVEPRPVLHEDAVHCLACSTAKYAVSCWSLGPHSLLHPGG